MSDPVQDERVKVIRSFIVGTVTETVERSHGHLWIEPSKPFSEGWGNHSILGSPKDQNWDLGCSQYGFHRRRKGRATHAPKNSDEGVSGTRVLGGLAQDLHQVVVHGLFVGIGNSDPVADHFRLADPVKDGFEQGRVGDRPFQERHNG